MAISSYKDLVVFPNDNSGRVYVNEQIFTSTSSWTVPAGVASAQVILVGAGGGGGGGSRDTAGGGGGGGAVVVKNLTVTPGTTYTVTIGAGGQGGQGAITSASDVANTLPGANGGATSFGTITIANLLVNAFFEYGATQWDANFIYRQVQGIASASTITVYPNANGLVAGMYVSGTNLGTNTQIVSIAGNVLTLSVANTATAVNTVATFNSGDAVISQANIAYNAVSSSTILSNTQAVGTPSAPYAYNLSNNLMAPRLSQLEDPTLISGALVQQFGTSLSTFSISNAGLPTKLTEMVVPLTKTATGTSGQTTVTLSDVNNIQTGMFIANATYFSSGTVILAISGNVVTLNNALIASPAGASVTISYNGTVGQYAMLATTAAGVSTSAPTWVNFSSVTGSTPTVASAGYTGIPYIPGQTYTVSAYVSANANISSSTPILFQLRSVGGSYGASTATNFLGGTNSGTSNSIDAGTSNGFFVRQATPTPLTGYTGTATANGTGSNGSTTITVDNAANVFIGMAVTGSGIQTGTTVTAMSSQGTNATITLSLATNAALSTTPLTFSTPTGVQILGSNITVGQTAWRRISATFTTPTFGATTANGVYGYGSTPQFIYPTIVFQQPSTSFWVDNVQLEFGSTATTWYPPLYNNDMALLATANSTAGGNVEVAHRFVKATAGNSYTGTIFALNNGTSSSYRPVSAFVEFFDADYNSLGRTAGTGYALPITGVATATQTNTLAAAAIPVRLGVTATAPTGTVYARLGASAYQAAQAASAIEYLFIAPQLEVAASATVFHRGNDGTYTFAGQQGNSQVVIAALTSAEGGGGGGTYNSAYPLWQYGLEGANNGGHAANGSYQYLTFAGGGAGSTQSGMPGTAYATTLSASTTSNLGANTSSTAGIYLQTFPLRGHLGGFAVTDSGTNASYAQGQGGDGGLGTVLSGLNSGSTLGISVAGGGGGAGWGSNSSSLTRPGRGNAGGGKGGGTYIFNNTGLSNYYARGIDAVANTGSGGGGGGSNQGSAVNATAAHLASAAVVYDTANANQYLWNPVYNVTTAITSSAGLYATNGLRVTMQDVGNGKVQTGVNAFPILPRTPLEFSGVAARLTTAPAGVTSTQFPGLAKRVRPTIRWKTYDMQIIREDRPAYDIIFGAVNTTTYLNSTASQTTSIGSWQTLQAPVNAAYFDVTWELLYMDAGDVIDFDFNGLNYFPYIANGGNGADGFAVVRWFDKAVF